LATKSLLFLSSSIYVGVIFNTSVVLHSYLACLIFGSSFLIAAGWNGNDACVRVGQNSIYTPYMTVYLVISLPKIPYTHRIHMVLANPVCLRNFISTAPTDMRLLLRQLLLLLLLLFLCLVLTCACCHCFCMPLF